MTVEIEEKPSKLMRNGLDMEAATETVAQIQANPKLAMFQFRARNQWIQGGENRSCGRCVKLVFDINARIMQVGADDYPRHVQHGVFQPRVNQLGHHDAQLFVQ